MKQEISPNIKEGYRFKKGELLIKRYVDNEISQKDIELINKSLNNSNENWTPVVKDIVKDISIGNIEEIKEES